MISIDIEVHFKYLMNDWISDDGHAKVFKVNFKNFDIGLFAKTLCFLLVFFFYVKNSVL